MARYREFERILDDCLDRLLLRGESVESCLARHPQQAGELESLLRAALISHRALAQGPPPQAKAQARLRLGQALEAQRRGPAGGWRGWPRLGSRWAALAAVALALALVAGAGTGAVAASASSLPNEPLYGVKRKAETVRVFFAVGDDSKANFYVVLVDRRLDEMAGMAQAGRPREVELLGQDLQGHLERIKALAGGAGQPQGVPPQPPDRSEEERPAPGPSFRPPPALETPPGDGARARRAEALGARLERNVERRRLQLELALASAPPEFQPRIQRAIAQTEERHGRALEEIKRRGDEAKRAPGPRQLDGADRRAPGPPGR